MNITNFCDGDSYNPFQITREEMESLLTECSGEEEIRFYKNEEREVIRRNHSFQYNQGIVTWRAKRRNDNIFL